MATKYNLEVLHNGTDCGDFCIFQTSDEQMGDIRPLFWYSKAAHPGTKLTFEWNIDYSLAWSEQGNLTPRVVLQASQIEYAAPGDITKDTLPLTQEKGAFCAGPSDNPAKSGKLDEVCGESIPVAVSVGVDKSGRIIQVCGLPPSQQYTFTPHPRYGVAFGEFKDGEALDPDSILQKYEIKYPENIYHRTVSLTPDNTWQEL